MGHFELTVTLKAELASGWDFFVIPNLRDRNSYFGLDRKIPKSRGLGSRYKNLKNSQKNLESQIPLSRGSRSGFENPKKSRKIPGIGIWIEKSPKNPDKISSGKSRKSRNPGDRDLLFIPTKSHLCPSSIPNLIIES